MKTLSELAAEIRRLDAAATPAPFICGGQYITSVDPVRRCIAHFPSGGGKSYGGERDKPQAKACAVLLTYLRNLAPLLAAALDECEAWRRAGFSYVDANSAQSWDEIKAAIAATDALAATDPNAAKEDRHAE